MGTLTSPRVGRHRAPWRLPLLKQLDPPPWRRPRGTRVAGVLLLVAVALLSLWAGAS